MPQRLGGSGKVEHAHGKMRPAVAMRFSAPAASSTCSLHQSRNTSCARLLQGARGPVCLTLCGGYHGRFSQQICQLHQCCVADKVSTSR